MKLEAISSPYLAVCYALDAGPRIVRLSRAGVNENLLGETPRLNWHTVHGEYRTIGGHRLWHAPQSSGRSDIPDDRPIAVEPFDGGIHLAQEVEAPTGILKAMTIRLFPDRAGLEITHQLTNCGMWTLEVAPWAITQLPLGGTAEVPLPVRPAGEDTHWPNRPLVFWPYSRLDEPRLQLETGRLLLSGQPGMPIFKIGCFCSEGWASYTRGGVTLRKRFTPYPEKDHTDLGSNVELFVSDQTIELETLGPLAKLEPGQSCTHIEVWEIF